MFIFGYVVFVALEFGFRCYKRLIPVFIIIWRNEMDEERASSELAWLLRPGEDAIFSANVKISLNPLTSFGVSGKACIIEEKEKM